MALEPITQGPLHQKRAREKIAARKAAERLLGPEVAIRKTSGGAPFAWQDDHAKPLSLSHSGQWAAAATVQTGRIGVDVERIDVRDPAWIPIAFHEAEGAATLSLYDQTRLWTLKEAVLKLLGIGLSVDLWDIRFVEHDMRLYGKAREAWENLGRPNIAHETHEIDPHHLVSVSYG